MLSREKLDSTCRDRFRTSDNVNQWVALWWQIAGGKFSPAVIDNLVLKITDYTIDELCDAIENQRHDYICLNDPEEEIDFYKLSGRLRGLLKKYFRIRVVLNDDVKNEDFEMKQTKGFITVATGKEEYYQLAANLLRSYHLFCNNPLPFAILADQKNTYTDKFDDVIVFPDGASHSYLDKLSLGSIFHMI